MKATIKSNTLIIEIPLSSPTPSKSGKTLMVATTNGFKTSDAKVDGKTVTIGVNAYISK